MPNHKYTIHDHEVIFPKNFKKNINSVYKYKNLIDGYFQKKCEKKIKIIAKSNFIRLTGSCSAALIVALRALNLKNTDEVILPSYNFTSAANAVLIAGAKIIYADVCPYTFCLDPRSVEKVINKNTKCILLVHYGAACCDMDKFLKLKKKYKLSIVEDAAHVFGSKYKNKYLGTIGDLGAFSFHQTKNIIGGQAGAISVNNKKFISNVEIQLDKGTDRKNFQSLGSKKKFYQWQGIGSEYRCPELSAAVLEADLRNIKKKYNFRSNLWTFYYKELAEITKDPSISLQSIPQNYISAFHNFCLVLKNKNQKELFIKLLRNRGIQASSHYYALHKSNFGKKFVNKITNLKNTDYLHNGLVRLPFHENLTKKDINTIVKVVKSFFYDQKLK